MDNKKLCRKCKKLIDDDSKYCKYCGCINPFIKIDTRVLVERLKAYRLMRADQQGWKPFCVFNDKVLNAIIDVLPQKMSDFDKVADFYGKKLDKYGKDIIRIISELDMNNV